MENWVLICLLLCGLFGCYQSQQTFQSQSRLDVNAYQGSRRISNARDTRRLPSEIQRQRSLSSNEGIWRANSLNANRLQVGRIGSANDRFSLQSTNSVPRRTSLAAPQQNKSPAFCTGTLVLTFKNGSVQRREKTSRRSWSQHFNIGPNKEASYAQNARGNCCWKIHEAGNGWNYQIIRVGARVGIRFASIRPTVQAYGC